MPWSQLHLQSCSNLCYSPGFSLFFCCVIGSVEAGSSGTTEEEKQCYFVPLIPLPSSVVVCTHCRHRGHKCGFDMGLITGFTVIRDDWSYVFELTFFWLVAEAKCCQLCGSPVLCDSFVFCTSSDFIKCGKWKITVDHPSLGMLCNRARQNIQVPSNAICTSRQSDSHMHGHLLSQT